MLAPRKYPEELRERATRMAVETRRALVVATGVSAQGRQEILSMALGNAETVDFWTSFLRSLRERGLKVPSPHDPEGLVLVTSGQHPRRRQGHPAWGRLAALPGPLRPQHLFQAGVGPL